MPATTKDKVRALLREFRSLVNSKDFYVIDRYENIEGLIALGITEKIRKKELLSLNVLNYSSGPTPDEDRRGKVWIFGKIVRSKEVYIKLKISQQSRFNKAICISFHPAVKSLSYPFLPDKNSPEL